MAERTILDPVWLYNDKREAELVTESARYHALLSAGWFPAEELMAHGIETHPARPHHEVVQTIAGPMADVVATAATQQLVLKDVEAALLQMQTTLATIQAGQTQHENLLSACMDAVAALEGDMTAANKANNALHQRLVDLEHQKPASPPEPPSEKPKASGGKP